MPTAVHVNATQTSQSSNSTTTYTTELTIAAATLTSAGFAANDDVIVMYLTNMEVNDTANHYRVQLTYDGTPLGSAEVEFDPGNLNRENTMRWWTRLDLGATVGDIDLDILSVDDPGEAFLNKAEITVVRLADFGVENTDWFHDLDTVLETHTTAWADTIGASLTWTPTLVEDWVVLSTVQIVANAASRSPQSRLNLDSGTIIAGEWRDENESVEDERRYMSATMLTSLAASEHTIEVENQEEASFNASQHRSSELLIFRKDVWADIYFAGAASDTLISQTEVEVLAITDTLSTTQDMILLGEAAIAADGVGIATQATFQDDTTHLEPLTRNGSGNRTSRTYDALDVKHSSNMAFVNLSGTLDLTFVLWTHSAVTEDLSHLQFLAWGMELAAVYPPFPRRQNTLVRM